MMTFWSMMDHIYNSSPIRLIDAEIFLLLSDFVAQRATQVFVVMLA